MVDGPSPDPPCHKLKDFGVIRTNAKGKASMQIELGGIPAMSTLFLDGYDQSAGTDNDAISVTV